MTKPTDRIPLKVMGLSYSQSQQGAYALILGQKHGPVRIPVVIGAAEAQAIALMIEGVNVPRPLTHDLMASTLRSFDIVVNEVFIYKFEDGVFSSEITMSDGLRQVTIDCRTSDAVALAMRMHCPISTTRAVMEETGFVMENENDLSGGEGGDHDDGDDNAAADGDAADGNASGAEPTLSQLEEQLRRAIADEMYEEAARLSAIIKERRAAEEEGGGSGSPSTEKP